MTNQNKDGGTNKEAAALIIPVISFLLISVLWMAQHYYISMVYVYVRYVELLIPALFSYILDVKPFSTARLWIESYCDPDGWGIVGVCKRDFESIKFTSILTSTLVINIILMMPLIYLCGKSFIKIVKTHPLLIFRKKHGIKSFMLEKQNEYPHLKMFVNLDLVSKDLSDPLFGMPLSSRDFVKKYGLIEGWQENADGRTFTPTLNIANTKRVLTEQLGRLWTGSNFMELTTSEVLMLAISIPVVAATDTSLDNKQYHSIKKESEEMLRFCWAQFIPPETDKKTKNINKKDDDYTWLSPEIDITKAREIIVRYYKQSKEVRKIFKKHAYVSTIIYGMFSEARRLGVLPAADVRWLRFYDPRMYVIISNIGRPSAHPEGCAIHAHYLFEAAGGTGYPEPLIDKAIEALQFQIQSYKYEQEQVETFSKAKVIHE